MTAKKVLKWGAIAVLAWITLLFVYGFTTGFIGGLQTSTSDPVPASLVQSDNPNETAKAREMEGGYMSSCDPEGTATAYCQCTYDFLKANYGLASMVRIGEEYQRTNELTEEMWRAVEACL